MAGNLVHNLLKKIVIALFLGVCCTLVLIQDDAWFKKNLGIYFTQAFGQALDCTMTADAKRVNVFTGTLELENVVVNPHVDEGWHWASSGMRVQFSWLNLLLYGSLDLQGELTKLRAHSDIQHGDLGIMTHLKKFADAPATLLPIFLRSLTVVQGELVVADALNNIKTTLNFHSETKKINDVLRSSIYFGDGCATIAGISLFTSLAGSMNLEITERYGKMAANVRADCSLLVPQLPESDRQCYVTGSWENEVGTIMIKNGNRTLVVDPLKIYPENNAYHAQLSAQMPLSYLLALYKPEQDFSGEANCTVQAKIDLSNPQDGIHGHVEIDNVRYGQLPFDGRAKFSLTRKNGYCKGGVTIMPAGMNFAGSWHWSERDCSGGLELTNSTAIAMPESTYWQLLPNAITMHLHVDCDGQISGSYQAKATHSKLASTLDSGGVLQATHANCTLDGFLGRDTYELAVGLSSQPHLNKFQYKNAQNVPLIDVRTHESETNKIQGFVDFEAVKTLFKNLADIDLQGEGTINISGGMQASKLVFDGNLEKGTIRLPGTYNFINGFDAHFIADTDQKKLLVESACLTLHQGKIESKRAVLLLDDTFKIKFAHVPCVFENCLINRQKDLFATISGRLLMAKRPNNDTSIKGTVFIDRAQLNKNIFSQEFRQGLQQSPAYLFDTAKRSIDCDIALVTKEPIRIKTGFIETRAQADLTIKNDIRNPAIAGHITLGAGTLAFPYKELLISKGDIYFLPHQPYDPLIELVAKNKIRKYTVALHVTGSAQNPYVHLEASPALTEEQIVSLLLVGSEDESLNIVVPALLMQNIKNMIVSSDQTSPTVNAYFAGLLKPLTNIRLVPRLNDQTGRGGLRAALEIEVGERWRAMMQKNFSLSEDTRFELEYLLSDEISLKGVRDERGDVRGEVEMRWKFGR